MGRSKEFFSKYRRVLIILGRCGSVVVSLVLVLFCNMFKSFNQEGFNFKAEFTKNLKDPLTWILAVSVAVAWAVVYIVVYMFCKEKKVEENKPLIVKFNELNRNKPNNFRDFLKRVINPRRKKLAYYDKMERSLMRVQNAIEKIPVDKLECKKHLRLKREEELIISKSTPEYVNKNLLHLNAKYNVVKLEHFTFAISSSKTTDQTNSNEKRKLARKLAGKICLGTVGSICGVSILSTLNGMFEWKETGLWITLLMILISIFIQVYFATDDANVLVDSEIIAPTLNKIEILEEAIMWKEADMKNKPFEKMVNELVEKQNKEAEQKKSATITAAELEYLQKNRVAINEAIMNDIKKGENKAEN